MQDEQILQAVRAVGVYVNKDELIRAITYDRQQYNKGYDDAIEEFAKILAELNMCPCNEPEAEELLSCACDYRYSCDCSFKECWKQLFKHWNEKEIEGDAE